MRTHTTYAIPSLIRDYKETIKKYQEGYKNRTLTPDEEKELFTAIKKLNKII